MAHLCGTCGKSTEPFGDFVLGLGVVQRCGNQECGAPVANGVAPLAPPAATTAPATQLPTGPRTASALVVELRARRAAVVAQLASFKALGDELALLDLMLTAAESAN